MTYHLPAMSVRVDITLALSILLTLPYSVGNGGGNITLKEENQTKTKCKIKKKIQTVCSISSIDLSQIHRKYCLTEASSIIFMKWS